MRHKNLVYYVGLLAVATLLAGCFGPKVGDVSGQVTDRDGTPIANATVAVANKMVVTDSDGLFALTEIRHGKYALTVAFDSETVATREIQVSSTPLWVPVVVDHAAQANLIQNFDFSQGVDDEGVPNGWVVFGRVPDEGADFEVTDEQARIGHYSLKITDLSNTRGVGIRSHDFAVVPGETYVLEVDVLVVSGAANAYIDFRKGTSRVEAKSGSAYQDPEWQRMIVELTVPEGAETVSVILYGNQVNVGVVYYDNVVLYKKVQ